MPAIEHLFLRYLQKEGPDDCWGWQGSTNGRYGIIQMPSPRRNVLAHRFSYEFFVGTIPRGSVVMHTCDNPLCVNPRHLRSGSQRDNMRDMAKKGRRACMPNTVGQLNGRAKLSVEAVREIRNSDKPCSLLARQLGVSASTISAVRSGRNWSHV